MKILVIEDDPAFKVLVSCIVKTAVSGLLDLVVAENVSEAQAAIDKNVDLVISDYDFGGGGFPALLPSIASLEVDYVVMSSAERPDVIQERFIPKSRIVEGLVRKILSLSA